MHHLFYCYLFDDSGMNLKKEHKISWFIEREGVYEVRLPMLYEGDGRWLLPHLALKGTCRSIGYGFQGLCLEKGTEVWILLRYSLDIKPRVICGSVRWE